MQMALAGVFRCLDIGLQLAAVDTCNSLRCARTMANAGPSTIGIEGSPYETEVPADRIPQLCWRQGGDPAAVVLAPGHGSLRANRTNRRTQRLSG
jgi:hypothetical protein